jgi:hypothetical protein
MSNVVTPVLHPEPTIKPATSNDTAASKSQPPASEPEIRWTGKKLTKVSGAQHPKTPVLVAGEAQVNSQPDGAQVRFDGNTDPVFVTPASVEAIPIGHHSVIFSKPGFISQTVALEVAAGVRSTLTVRLLPSRSIFNVSSTPSGATILLDGESTSLISPAELRVNVSGTHTITLVHPGFLTAESQVSVRNGESSSVTFTLIPVGNAANSKIIRGIRRFLPGGSSKEMASVQFKTNPKGARLMLNGWSAPKTTPLELKLPPGGYNVSIRADGFKPFSKEIVVEAGQNVVLQEALERSSSLDNPK